MVICEDGNMVGSLSAGCLEEEIALRAREVLRTGEPSLVNLDTRRRFGCAGKIEIFIERAADSFFAHLAKELDARRSCFAVTSQYGTIVGEAVSFPSPTDAKSQTSEADSFPYRPLIQKIHPPIRLLIFGEGPDSRPFHLLGNLLGWEVIENVELTPIESDQWTAAIVKSHNYGRDFAALQKLLPLDLPYVGLIGPRKRRNQLLTDLLDLRVTINTGFFAPAGLDLGAETSEEIALAVVSEIQRVFGGASGESLRDRKLPIHAPVKSAITG